MAEDGVLAAAVEDAGLVVEPAVGVHRDDDRAVLRKRLGGASLSGRAAARTRPEGLLCPGGLFCEEPDEQKTASTNLKVGPLLPPLGRQTKMGWLRTACWTASAKVLETSTRSWPASDSAARLGRLRLGRLRPNLVTVSVRFAAVPAPKLGTASACSRGGLKRSIEGSRERALTAVPRLVAQDPAGQ